MVGLGDKVSKLLMERVQAEIVNEILRGWSQPACHQYDTDGAGYIDDMRPGRDDCTDSDATIYSGAPEICGDLVDQDCAQA